MTEKYVSSGEGTKKPESESEIAQRYLDLIKKHDFDPQEADYFLGLVHEMMELTGGREPKVVCSESDVELSEKCVAKMNELIVFIERRKIGQPGGALLQKHNIGSDILEIMDGDEIAEDCKVERAGVLADGFNHILHKTTRIVSYEYEKFKTLKYKDKTVIIGENDVLGTVLINSPSSNVFFQDSPEKFENIRFDEELDLVIISVGSEDFVFDPLTGKKLSSGYHKIFKRDNKIYGILGAKEEEINPYGEQGLIDIVGDRLDEKYSFKQGGATKVIVDESGRTLSRPYHEFKKFKHENISVLIAKVGRSLAILKKDSSGYFEEILSDFVRVRFDEKLGSIIVFQDPLYYIVDLPSGKKLSKGFDEIYKRDDKVYGKIGTSEEEIKLD